MANPSVTYTFTANTTIDPNQMNTNFSNVIAGITDGTKTLTIAAIVTAGITLSSGAPASTSFATINTSGVLAAGVSTTNGITRSMLAAVGQASSNSSAVLTISSLTYTPILTINSITTTGRPVVVAIISDGSVSQNSSIEPPGGGQTLSFKLVRDGSTVISTLTLNGAAATIFPPGVIAIDTSATAGSHSYVLDAIVTGGSGGMVNCVLVAYEL